VIQISQEEYDRLKASEEELVQVRRALSPHLGVADWNAPMLINSMKAQMVGMRDSIRAARRYAKDAEQELETFAND
jgi:hypothetical protein